MFQSNVLLKWSFWETNAWLLALASRINVEVLKCEHEHLWTQIISNYKAEDINGDFWGAGIKTLSTCWKHPRTAAVYSLVTLDQGNRLGAI